MENENNKTDGEAELGSSDLLACPHCGSEPKEQSSATAAWISCSNYNDPCPSYDDDGEPIHPLDIVTIDGAKWLVLSVESDIKERERDLRLLEVLD